MGSAPRRDISGGNDLWSEGWRGYEAYRALLHREVGAEPDEAFQRLLAVHLTQKRVWPNAAARSHAAMAGSAPGARVANFWRHASRGL